VIEQLIQFRLGQASLHEKQVNGGSQSVAGGEFFIAKNGQGAPAEVSQIREAQALADLWFVVPEVRNAQHDSLQGRQIGAINGKGGWGDQVKRWLAEIGQCRSVQIKDYSNLRTSSNF